MTTHDERRKLIGELTRVLLVVRTTEDETRAATLEKAIRKIHGDTMTSHDDVVTVYGVARAAFRIWSRSR